MTTSANRTRFTYEEYCLFPDDGHRHEVIGGEHYMNPAPNLGLPMGDQIVELIDEVGMRDDKVLRAAVADASRRRLELQERAQQALHRAHRRNSRAPAIRAGPPRGTG